MIIAVDGPAASTEVSPSVPEIGGQGLTLAVQARDGLEAARDRHPFLGRLDVVVRVVVDDAVAVEDDEFHMNCE